MIYMISTRWAKTVSCAQVLYNRLLLYLRMKRGFQEYYSIVVSRVKLFAVLTLKITKQHRTNLKS